MRCACESLILVLNGNEADEYANKHLHRIDVDAVTLDERFDCPHTGATWIMDYPDSHLHGGGSPRLRKLDES